MTTLFIGRFQPFHLGHLSVLQDMDNNPKVDEITIGIGSSQYNHTEDNPYTFEIRQKMIGAAIENEIKKPCRIIAVPDIHDDKRWVGHVEKIVGKFDLVCTGNDWVKKLFEEKGYTIKTPKINIDISATKLREMINNNDETWKKYVPKRVIKLI